MTQHGEVAVRTDFGRRTAMAAFLCDECRWMSIGTASLQHADGVSSQHDLARELDTGYIVEWLPPAGVGREFEDVSEHVGQAASEAYKCQSIGAHRAAVSLARSVVEATAKEKGVTKGNLADKIDAMHDQGLLREHVRDAAHEVRHLGNEMAHGDFVQPVTAEEAEEVLELMAEVLHEVFQSPARVERRKQVRLAKQQQKTLS